MVVIVKQGSNESQVENLISWLKGQGLETHISAGEYQTIIGLVGDTSKVDIDLLNGLNIVESVTRISDPFKSANRKFHPDDSIVDIGGIKIGGGNFGIIACPSSTESLEITCDIATSIKQKGADILCASPFKSRTSPYSYQGSGVDGLGYVAKAKEKCNIPCICEIANLSQLQYFADSNIDSILIGSKNMQNIELLREVGKLGKPIILKRGVANTLQELLMSAEYIMSTGNADVILCERGIRTFEPYTTNTFDISAIPVLKEKSHLPVLVDPSHACGNRNYVKSLVLASVACSCDGVMVEVHPDPDNALCDSLQSINLDDFSSLCDKINKIRNAMIG